MSRRFELRAPDHPTRGHLRQGADVLSLERIIGKVLVVVIKVEFLQRRGTGNPPPQSLLTAVNWASPT